MIIIFNKLNRFSVRPVIVLRIMFNLLTIAAEGKIRRERPITDTLIPAGKRRHISVKISDLLSFLNSKVVDNPSIKLHVQ